MPGDILPVHLLAFLTECLKVDAHIETNPCLRWLLRRLLQLDPVITAEAANTHHSPTN